MPIMNGIDATVQIRKSNNCKTPIITVAANTNTEYNGVQNCLDAGANGYVIKPFTLLTLEEEFKKVGLVL